MVVTLTLDMEYEPTRVCGAQSRPSSSSELVPVYSTGHVGSWVNTVAAGVSSKPSWCPSKPQGEVADILCPSQPLALQCHPLLPPRRPLPRAAHVHDLRTGQERHEGHRPADGSRPRGQEGEEGLHHGPPDAHPAGAARLEQGKAGQASQPAGTRVAESPSGCRVN